jgi:hypothetical protein
VIISFNVLKVNLKFTHHQFLLIDVWQTDRHIIGALVVALVLVCKDRFYCLMRVMVCVGLT